MKPPAAAAFTPEIEIARIEKNAAEVVRITLTEFAGHKLVSVRIWTKGASGPPVPTKSGFALRVDKIDDLLGAITRAGDEARARGWVG